MAEASNVPAQNISEAPPHAYQPVAGFLLRRYPVLWQGQLTLKEFHALVQLHFISGNPNIARASLPPLINGKAEPIKIARRMRMDPTQLNALFGKMQLPDEHCILMALPCGKDGKDLVKQAQSLRSQFTSYFFEKDAAGIVNVAAPGTEQPISVIHIFPSCDFTRQHLSGIAPNLLHFVGEISYLVIIIATVSSEQKQS